MSFRLVHYNAYFEMNDEPFDSTYLRSKTFEFKLGAGEVVAGLDIAVATMKKRVNLYSRQTITVASSDVHQESPLTHRVEFLK